MSVLHVHAYILLCFSVICKRPKYHLRSVFVSGDNPCMDYLLVQIQIADDGLSPDTDTDRR